MSKVRKPCRYKACKGRIHPEGEKCPVASSRGKKGGSGKKSETWIQNRIGSKNPNFKGTRKCGCPIRQHLPNCSQSRMSKIKINAINNHDFNNYNPLSKSEYIFDAMQDKIKIVKIARKENIPLKRTVANWELENAVKVKNSSVTDIRKVIADSINQRKQIITANNQILTYTKSKKVSILAEESDVSTIINNIIDNAIKYSGKNSKINIAASIIKNKNNKEMVLVKIQDNGIGIEEKHLPKIKDRFYRVDKARSKSSNSSGLGLSIVKSLLDKNNGKFDIFSIFGKGTEVCLYFNKFIK